MLRAPRWFWSLATGVPFGLCMGIFTAWQGGSAVGAVVGGVFAGTFFGFFMGRFQVRMIAVLRPAIQDLSYGERRAASRAATRGPLPDDPRIRAAAAVLVRMQIADSKVLGWSKIVLPGVAVVSVINAFTSSRWWFVAVGFFAAMTIFQWWAHRRFTRRAALFEQQPISG